MFNKKLKLRIKELELSNSLLEGELSIYKENKKERNNTIQNLTKSIYNHANEINRLEGIIKHMEAAEKAKLYSDNQKFY